MKKPAKKPAKPAKKKDPVDELLQQYLNRHKDDPKAEPPPPKLRIRAIRDFIIIHPDQRMTTAPGSLIVAPDSTEDENNPTSGIVVEVGCGLVEGGQIIPLKVKVGQRVYFPRHSGTLFKNHPTVEDCFVIRENQVFGAEDAIRADERPAFKMQEGMGASETISGWDHSR